MDVLLLRLDAPLMSFGGVQVDQRGPTRPWPSRSMITGLLANALGYEHRDWQRLQRLQDRLTYGVRQDRIGSVVTDFHTADLGQDFMRSGWTTRREREGRKGGAAKAGTHIRYRQYLAGAACSVALGLKPGGQGDPSLSDLEMALGRPRRPLYVGRRPCIPAVPVLLGRMAVSSLIEALQRAPIAEQWGGATQQASTWVTVWLPADEAPEADGEVFPVVDQRDWRNQIHVGRRFLWRGRILVGDTDHGAS